MPSITIDKLVQGPARKAAAVNSIPGSLATPLSVATFGAAIVTEGPASFYDASHFNVPSMAIANGVVTAMAESDANGLTVIQVPDGAKHMVLYPFLWHATAVDNVQADWRQWFVEMGHFGSNQAKGPEASAYLEGEYRGQFRATAGNKTFPAGDPRLARIGSGQAAHADTIDATLDGEAIGAPKIVGGLTANEARHGVPQDVEGVAFVVLQGKKVSSGAKIGFVVRFI